MLKINVTTLNLTSDAVTSHVIDHDDYESRKWLARHTWWAIRNGHMVAVSESRADAPVTMHFPQVMQQHYNQQVRL